MYIKHWYSQNYTCKNIYRTQEKPLLTEIYLTLGGEAFVSECFLYKETNL